MKCLYSTKRSHKQTSHVGNKKFMTNLKYVGSVPMRLASVSRHCVDNLLQVVEK